jgi:hypothetical protein
VKNPPTEPQIRFLTGEEDSIVVVRLPAFVHEYGETITKTDPRWLRVDIAVLTLDIVDQWNLTQLTWVFTSTDLLPQLRDGGHVGVLIVDRRIFDCTMYGHSRLNLFREFVAGQFRRLSVRECPIEVVIKALTAPLVGKRFTSGAVLDKHCRYHPVWILSGLFVQTTLPFSMTGNLIWIGKR